MESKHEMTIANILHDKKVKSKQIMRKCNVSLTTACCWMRGANVPQPRYLENLAKVVEVDHADLIKSRQYSLKRARVLIGEEDTRGTTVTRDLNFIARPKAMDSKEHAERCKHLMAVANVYSTLSEEEKVVVGLMSDALSLLKKEGTQ